METKASVCYLCKTVIGSKKSNLRPRQWFKDDSYFDIAQVSVKCKNGHTNAVDIIPEEVDDEEEN